MKKINKIIYCNPIFLDYRLPFYIELNRLFNGKFHVLFSKWRYEGRRDDLLARILDEMKDNAIPFNGERVFDTKTLSFSKFPHGKRIPLVWGLLKKLRRENPDVVISEGFFQWTPLVLMYCIFWHKPLFIGYERTLWTERHTASFSTWTRKLTDMFTTGYLVNGQETTKYLKSIGVKPEKIFVGGMSADSEGLRKNVAEFKSSNDFYKFHANFHKNGGLMYLFSGRVENLKGAPHLLSAWMKHIEKNPNDTLVLIGHGDKSAEMQEKYKNVPSIYLEGKIDYQCVHKYYAVADVFILPTLQDNWSLVIPEAMSCGLPVATTIYNGCYSELIIEGKNGCVFDSLNEGSIINALEYFHHVDLLSHGESSIEIERKFNTENSARREYEGIINALNISKS